VSGNKTTPSKASGIGFSDPVLPGESPSEYQSGLKLLIEQLEAKTVLQVYLAEKIFDCLWWIHRYQAQKRQLVIEKMVKIAYEMDWREDLPTEQEFRDAFSSGKINKKIQAALDRRFRTLETVKTEALDIKSGSLRDLDDQVALQAKILAGFQASYEVASNRKLVSEKLTLQNQLLRKDLGALDGEAGP
jgi:hypothetical protein